MPDSNQTIIDRVRSGTGTTAMEYTEYRVDVLALCDFAEQAQADLARVTEQRDGGAGKCTPEHTWKQWADEHIADNAALRASVADLEHDAEFQKQYAEAGDVKLAQERAINVQLETERNAAKELARHRIEVHELMTEQRNEARAERDGWRTRAGQAKQRNVELVAALRKATTELRRLEAEWIDEELGRLHSPQLIEAEDALARAESATPAKQEVKS